MSPIYCYRHQNVSRTLEDSLIRLIQNPKNGRDTLGSNMWARANDDDIFLEGDSYTFTWPDEFGAPSLTMTVDPATADPHVGEKLGG